MKPNEPALSPLRQAMREAILRLDLSEFVRLSKNCTSIQDRFAAALALSLHLQARGREKACRGMLRQARLIAADDYRRLQLVNVIQEGIRLQPDFVRHLFYDRRDG